MDRPAGLLSALDDLRVLELTDEAGQHCGKLLADQGADVLKIEPPGGSSTRRVGPFFQDVPDPNRSLYFWHYNTSKRGITLNLETPDGQDLLRRLIPATDIVLETYPPGYLPERGLGYDQVRSLNPGLIYCSLTPFGQDGPWRDYRASDLTLLASGGQMAICGYDAADDPDETPIAPSGGNGWHLGAHYATLAILLALNARHLFGKGQYIDVSIHEAISLCTEGSFPDYLYTGLNRKRQTGRHASIGTTPRIQFRCQDGRHVNCTTPRLTDAAWLQLVDWLDQTGQAEDLMDDRYLDPAVLAKAMPHVFEVMERFCATHTADEVYHGAQQRKLPWTLVRSPEELLDDPHLHDRGFFVEVEHPELDRSFTYPGAPYIAHGTPWRIRRRAPLLGEDNLAVYHEELGIGLDRLNALHELGVI